MLESARRNMNITDTISVFSDLAKVELFRSISKEDLKANGQLRPMGSRYFSEQQRRIQNLNNLIGIKLNDQSIGAHLSGKKIAQLLAEELEEHNLFQDNVLVKEQAETKKAALDSEADVIEDLEAKARVGE